MSGTDAGYSTVFASGRRGVVATGFLRQVFGSRRGG